MGTRAAEARREPLADWNHRVLAEAETLVTPEELFYDQGLGGVR